MGRVQVSGRARARLGVLLGAMTASTGVGLALGVALGLVAGGLGFAAWCLFLADVDPPEGGGREGRP
ncbi:hypothetical protein ACFWCA_32825 [Streptomyces phaeochromogenes]|uniref:hypothetical protein n=1 Tax=Streptomyces phaeochromogenes TaxID=1923 RepID=UPI0036BFA3AF